MIFQLIQLTFYYKYLDNDEIIAILLLSHQSVFFKILHNWKTDSCVENELLVTASQCLIVYDCLDTKKSLSLSLQEIAKIWSIFNEVEKYVHWNKFSFEI